MENKNKFLSLSNVVAVGGSWLVTKDDVVNEDYQSITDKCLALG